MLNLKEKTDLMQSVLTLTSSVLFSRAVSSQVFSTMRSLTSVFGMRTGGPSLYLHWLWYNNIFLSTSQMKLSEYFEYCYKYKKKEDRNSNIQTENKFSDNYILRRKLKYFKSVIKPSTY